MRRFLGFLLVAGLFIGGASGCSSDDDKNADTKTESTEGGGETTESSNDEVKEYCTAVDDYIKAAQDVGTDTAKAQALTEQGTELTKKATALAGSGLSAEDAQAVADCTKKSAEALMPS